MRKLRKVSRPRHCASSPTPSDSGSYASCPRRTPPRSRSASRPS